MDEAINNWASWDWFRLSTLKSFSWEHPIYIQMIALIPLLFVVRWGIAYYRNQKLAVALIKGGMTRSPLTLLRFVPEILFGLILILILISLARPKKTNEKVEQWSEGIDIVLVIDISQSMQIEDFTPNRLEAAKNVARNFVSGRMHDRIGIVVFSGEAFSLTPLTTDYDLLQSYLNGINFDMIANRGTAIGSALAVAINRMAESESKSKVCIILSDGDNTAGNIDPITAAELAVAYNIKLYTIVIGKEGMVPFGRDYFGRPQMVDNSIDERTMRKIAKIGSGEFFRASNNEALKQVFSKIDKYEKVEIEETRFKDTIDFYYIYLRWAIVLFLVWLLLKSTFLSNALQD